MAPRVLLLTSHPVAPPWNSGDKNLSRTLLLGDTGVDYTFVGDRGDYTPWPQRHRRVPLGFTSDVPRTREKARVLLWLLRTSTQIAAVHAVVTFRSELAQHLLLRTPVVARHPMVLTCPSGAMLPLPLLRHARAAVALSRRTAAAMEAAGCREVRLVRPGVDLCRFRPGPAVAARSVLGLRDRPTMLFAGHHDPGAGLDAALRLAAEVRRSVPDLQLLLGLRLRPGDSAEGRRLEVEAAGAELGLAAAITELGPYANMRAALQAADVVVFQPDDMGAKMELPMTLLEALACGRPVIVSPLAPLSELADESPAVSVLPSRSAASAALARTLLSDAAARAEAGAAARSLAERRYSAAAMVAAYAGLYRDIGLSLTDRSVS